MSKHSNNNSIDTVMARLLTPAGLGEQQLSTTLGSVMRGGVDYAGEAATWSLRFAIRGNPHVSRPRLWL